jgi:hypothetical protein
MWDDFYREDPQHWPPVHEWPEQKPKTEEAELWSARVEEFLATPDDEKRFNFPFPMGVFGTLRSHQGNNFFMQRGTASKIRPAFLPHFYARGLSIGFAKDSCAPFEVFYYEPHEWVKMIGGVDGLESFSPERHYKGKYESGYYRTLAWLRLLPEGHISRWFPQGERANLSEHRNMGFDKVTWDEYKKVPCWIYSSIYQNRVTKETVKDSPIIWPTEL